MKRKVKKILSLQEYAKKRRTERIEFFNSEDCDLCELYRKENEVCIAGNNIIKLKSIYYCPITNRKLEVNRDKF